MILRWPGVTDGRAGECDDRLLYNIDMAATTLELAGDCDLSQWDGTSFASGLHQPRPHRESLVLSQLAWCAQRSARWEKYLCIETYHDGWHDYPDIMVFDLEADPHEQHNLANSRPDLVEKGKEILSQWKADCLESAHVKQDPLEEVMAEGGPLHVRDDGPSYLKRLRETGREEIADHLAEKHGITP